MTIEITDTRYGYCYRKDTSPMVREYWERIDKEINDAIFRAVILTWHRNLEYVKVIDLLIAIRELEKERLEIRRG